MGTKKHRKNKIPFGGKVAEVIKNGHLYWVCIKQTPKAHAALEEAANKLQLDPHHLNKKEAQLLQEAVNKAYTLNPDVCKD